MVARAEQDMVDRPLGVVVENDVDLPVGRCLRHVSAERDRDVSQPWAQPIGPLWPQDPNRDGRAQAGWKPRAHVRRRCDPTGHASSDIGWRHDGGIGSPHKPCDFLWRQEEKGFRSGHHFDSGVNLVEKRRGLECALAGSNHEYTLTGERREVAMLNGMTHEAWGNVGELRRPVVESV